MHWPSASSLNLYSCLPVTNLSLWLFRAEWRSSVFDTVRKAGDGHHSTLSSSRQLLLITRRTGNQSLRVLHQRLGCLQDVLPARKHVQCITPGRMKPKNYFCVGQLLDTSSLTSMSSVFQWFTISTCITPSCLFFVVKYIWVFFTLHGLWTWMGPTKHV